MLRNTHPRRRLLMVAGAVSVALVAGAVAISVTTAREGEDRAGSPSVTPSPDQSATLQPDPSITSPATDPELTEDGASVTVTTFLDAAANIGSDPTIQASSLGNIATGPILDEIESDSTELESNGWTRTGKPIVENARIVNMTESTATVEACIDSTTVQVIDSSGDPLPKDANSSRSINLYTLGFDGSTWRISSRTFPNDPAC